jgi:diguanylate cyclase (GGDEF)-like protein
MNESASLSSQAPNAVKRLLLLALLIMSLMAGMVAGLTWYTAHSMDEAHIETQRAAIENGFSNRLADMLREQKSVAWWDDAVVHASRSGFDRDWLDQSLGVFLSSTYRHDAIIILDENNQSVYSHSNGDTIEARQLRAAVQAAQPLIAQVRGGANASPRVGDIELLYGTADLRRFRLDKTGRAAAALVALGNKPALMSLMAIVPDKEAKLLTATPRILISIIHVDKSLLAEIGAIAVTPDLSFRRKADKRVGAHVLRTDGSSEAGALRWSTRLPGRTMLVRIMPFIVGFIVLLVMAITYLGRTLVKTTGRLARREQEAQNLANHDALTGLPNRRKLETRLKAYEAAQRPLIFAIVDLDRFKDINDTLGHAAGDALIRAVADRLRGLLAPDDMLARLGGDEFAILRPITCHEAPRLLGEAIGHAFDLPFAVVGNEIESHASTGISVSSAAGVVDDLLRQADIALYDVKARKRGGYTLFKPEMAEAVEKRRILEVELKHAIAERHLTLAYQPIVDAWTGAISAAEALVRWTSPTQGPVRPDIFVAIAEEVGLMTELGRAVLEQAFKDCARWPGVETAINISPAQLRSRRFITDLAALTRKYRVRPQSIIMEITENVLLSNTARTRETLQKVKAMGFRLALDDFGTGYSSLAYVRDFPFDKLKIDRSFVQGQTLSHTSLEIVSAVVNIGRSLGQDVVAEGVETEAEMQAMQAAGVTHLQGFLFAKPMPADQLEALISTTRNRLSAQSSFRKRA